MFNLLSKNKNRGQENQNNSNKNYDSKKIKKIFWKDIKVNDEFVDGSKVLSIHEQYIEDCYSVNETILSSTHLLLCDISKTNNKTKKWIDEEFGKYEIPTLYDKHCYFKNLDETIRKYEDENRSEEDGLVYMNKDQIMSMLQDSSEDKYEVVESDPCKIGKYLYWLPVETIYNLIKVSDKNIRLIKEYSDNRNYKINKIKEIKYVGKRDVFCVETDSHRFETCGMVHHNSVTLRNIIMHCLTHGQKICIGLIDLKFTEFVPFKGVKNVVAVANTVKEAAELLRLMREVMYKRNQEMSKIGINDIKDFKPTKPTNEYMIYNRKFSGDEEVEIRLKNGEIKTVKVKEIEKYIE